jgi:hypothetical protein
MNSLIDRLKNIRLDMANTQDTIMHIAGIFGKNMTCFLWFWGEQS